MSKLEVLELMEDIKYLYPKLHLHLRYPTTGSKYSIVLGDLFDANDSLIVIVQPTTLKSCVRQLTAIKDILLVVSYNGLNSNKKLLGFLERMGK